MLRPLVKIPAGHGDRAAADMADHRGHWDGNRQGKVGGRIRDGH
jgi:hypothetical protein